MRNLPRHCNWGRIEILAKGHKKLKVNPASLPKEISRPRFFQETFRKKSSSTSSSTQVTFFHNMAPSAVDVEAPDNGNAVITQKATSARSPLKSSGTLDQHRSIDITPIIGTEFPEANLVDWLNGPNADAILRDLAIKSKPIRAYLLTKSCSLARQSRSEVSSSSESRII